MKLQLAAIDTWFFRDSTPFHMNDSPQTGVVGMFPPYPATVAGAVRAALARQAGWDGQTRWRDELVAILGDGPADLGRLHITGPFVLCDGAPAFPVPRHVVGCYEEDATWTPKALLRPGRHQVPSDLGPGTRLPEAPVDAGDRRASVLEPGAGWWLTLPGLRRLLRGELPHPQELLCEHELWATEPRVGIQRKRDSRTVEDGALYSTRHVRPSPRVTLGVALDGAPPSWCIADSMIPLGGESRLAACQTWNGAPEAWFNPPGRDARTAVVVALTPVLLDAAAPARLELVIPGARIVSACIDRPLRIGGWDSRERTPRPLRNAAPPGSVWFCELLDPDAFHAAVVDGLVRAGAGTAAGFGLCVTGSAPNWETTK